MDYRERTDDVVEALRMALDGRQAHIWTALVGIVQSFDAVAMTCVVQPAIQGRQGLKDGSHQFINMPLLLDCPVIFPSGGQCILTFPIVKGDECLVLIANRCIDAWWQQGGIQPQAEARMHDLSDGFALVGARSRPHVVAGVSTTTAQLRSLDGQTYVDFDPTGQVVKIKALGGITLDGDVTITGNTTVQKNATFSGTNVTHGGVNIGQTHVHGGVTAGAADSGVPH